MQLLQNRCTGTNGYQQITKRVSNTVTKEDVKQVTKDITKVVANSSQTARMLTLQEGSFTRGRHKGLPDANVTRERRYKREKCGFGQCLCYKRAALQEEDTPACTMLAFKRRRRYKREARESDRCARCVREALPERDTLACPILTLQEEGVARGIHASLT